MIPSCVGSNPTSPAICDTFNWSSRVVVSLKKTLGKIMTFESLMVFTGNANPALADEVVRDLHIPLGRATVGRFSDGEVMVELLENVRGQDAFILQSTCTPTTENLMEVVLMADALKRASAGRITAAVPYFGYARQDRRPQSARVAISAKVVANMLQSVGVDRLLTMDLHTEQIQGFFDIPVDNVYSTSILLGDIWKNNYDKVVVVSPDVGGVVRARALAKRLECDLAIIDKRRPKANEAEVMNIVGDVRDRTCLLVDDIVDTAGTLCAAAEVLKKNGANRVAAYCTHPVLSGTAIDNIDKSTLDEVVVTDTIPLAKKAQESEKIRQLSVADALAESIRRISNEESLSALFNKRVQPTLF